MTDSVKNFQDEQLIREGRLEPAEGDQAGAFAWQRYGLTATNLTALARPNN